MEYPLTHHLESDIILAVTHKDLHVDLHDCLQGKAKITKSDKVIIVSNNFRVGGKKYILGPVTIDRDKFELNPKAYYRALLIEYYKFLGGENK